MNASNKHSTRVIATCRDNPCTLDEEHDLDPMHHAMSETRLGARAHFDNPSDPACCDQMNQAVSNGFMRETSTASGDLMIDAMRERRVGARALFDDPSHPAHGDLMMQAMSNGFVRTAGSSRQSPPSQGGKRQKAAGGRFAEIIGWLSFPEQRRPVLAEN